jgi:hypothetical protein
VGDTELEGFQEVSIESLKEARSSEHGPSFMHPSNAQYSMIRRPDGKHPPLAAGVKVAIQKVANNMLRPSMNSNGIQGLKLFASSIPYWKEKLAGESKDAVGKSIARARLMFELLHGYIETWGTGGGSFRYLYARFLEELVNHPEMRKGPKVWSDGDFKILEKCIPLIRESARTWTTIAETLKQAVDDHKDDCIDNIDLNNLQEHALLILNKEELLFQNLLKLKV